MPFYNVNGVKLHTVEGGPANRQVALMIHGWSSSWYAMSPLLGLLVQRFRTIAVDLPGYGESEPLPDRVTIPDYAELLADFAEKVTDGPVVLVGHSMGGMTSITMALRHPPLVERMVLISPTITGKLSSYINFLVSPITLLERSGLGTLLVKAAERLLVGISDRLMRPASFAERTGITEEEYLRLRSDVRNPEQGRVRAECFFAMRENDLRGRLGKIRIPSLVIWGAEDNTVPLRDAGVVADEWPGADLRILPKAGHWAHFESPDTVRRQVAAFLGLPLYSDDLYTPGSDEERELIREAARFLAHSDLGNNLSLAQRARLATQCRRYVYPPGAKIVYEDTVGNELYIIQDGVLEVWIDPDLPGQPPENIRPQAILRPGQIAGELAMIDQGQRSADLVAGPDGATVLGLTRERLLALCEDDTVLGVQLLWNMTVTMSQRVRFVQWQLQREWHKKAEEEQAPDKKPVAEAT
jgi:pimeloyl-ACP methyl ester carboxylesterase/CRP-like cAMP-binding protein